MELFSAFLSSALVLRWTALAQGPGAWRPLAGCAGAGACRRGEGDRVGDLAQRRRPRFGDRASSRQGGSRRVGLRFGTRGPRTGGAASARPPFGPRRKGRGLLFAAGQEESEPLGLAGRPERGRQLAESYAWLERRRGDAAGNGCATRERRECRCPEHNGQVSEPVHEYGLDHWAGPGPVPGSMSSWRRWGWL